MGGLATARIGGLKSTARIGGWGVKLILAMPVFSDHFLRSPFPPGVGVGDGHREMHRCFAIF